MMNEFPDAIVQHILSQASNARDIASFACVAKTWRDSVPFVPSLFFPRNAFDSVPRHAANEAMDRMITSSHGLEELIVYCSFPVTALSSWLSLRNRTLRRLELRMDSAAADKASTEIHADKLGCIGVAKSLEELKLWGVSMVKSPGWKLLGNLRCLEIVGATIRGNALNDAIQSCPNLTDLVLLGCEGVSSLSIELDLLERCRLDFLGPIDCSLSICSPRVKALEIQGFTSIAVRSGQLLQSISIAKNSGTVYKVDLGKLPDLEYMSLRGVQWSWNSINSVLESAREVKHLVIKIEFTGDFDALLPFPEFDLVEFFNSHPKLKKFEIHGAMFAALCQKNSLKNLDHKFVIPCLEEVLITVRSAFNADEKLSTLKALLQCSVKLLRMNIRISQMRNWGDADGFFKEICKFHHLNNNVVQIE